jgi:hypothetical protein
MSAEDPKPADPDPAATAPNEDAGAQGAGFYSWRRKEDMSELEAEWERARPQLEKYFR